jgi:hypothetical protein
VRDEIKSKLDAVFAKHDESKRKAAEAHNKESSFLRAFLNVREETIRPAMDEVGEYVRGQGYTFRISTEEDGLSKGGTNRPIPASIKIEFPIGEPPTYDIPVPSFKVICEKDTQRVLFHENTTGGQSSSAGDASLSELTGDILSLPAVLGMMSKRDCARLGFGRLGSAWH